MPNRIIKESIRTSDTVAEMTDFQFRLWVGLIVSADDYGRGDARSEILKGQIFPLRKKVKEKDIESALNGLAALGCVELYTVNGKPYYSFPTWGAHQRIRSAVQKFPSPDEKDASAASCGELRRVAASCGESRLESNPIQSKKESESESESNTIGRFSPPSVEQVTEYCKERNNKVDPQSFVDFYTAKGWMVGKNKMRDWKAAVRTWEQNRREQKKRNPALYYEQTAISKSDFDAMVVDLGGEP